jgi:hypothetical protein
LPCGTGTVIFQKVGTGTIINYGYGTVIKVSQHFSQTHSIKLCIDFLHLTFFSFAFYYKFDETYKFFPCKKALNVKGMVFVKKNFENCFL